jgi:hypothetical protein
MDSHSQDDRRFVSLKEAIWEIEDSDLLLFRRRGLISIAGRGEHSHAAKAAWWDGDLMCLEVREWVGGRAVTLASQVAKYPRLIDVYEIDPDQSKGYDRQGAVAFMRRKFAGSKYGYSHVLWASLLHLPVARIFYRPQLRDSDLNGKPPFCSEAVAMADRIGGGVDPVNNLADKFTEPADLARSILYRYRMTLLP